MPFLLPNKKKVLRFCKTCLNTRFLLYRLATQVKNKSFQITLLKTFFPHGKNLKKKNLKHSEKGWFTDESRKDRGSVASEGSSSSQRASRSVQEGKYKFATSSFCSTSRLFKDQETDPDVPPMSPRKRRNEFYNKNKGNAEAAGDSREKLPLK